MKATQINLPFFTGTQRKYIDGRVFVIRYSLLVILNVDFNVFFVKKCHCPQKEKFPEG